MEQATQVFMDYAAAFEETYVDDDWSRLTPFFSKDATYEVRGGPLACKLDGRSAATVANGLIVALRDEYTDEEMAKFGVWMQEHGQGLGGAYV